MPYRRHSYSRSVSRSRSPPRRPRGEGTSLRRDPPSRCSLLLRNLPKGARESELRDYAEKYGPVRDVYLPRDYYTREPRGIGFVEYTSPRDAEDARYGLDGTRILDREISVVFAMQGRKRPEEYRRGGSSFKYGGSRYHRHVHSRTPPKRRSRSRSSSHHRSHTHSPPRRRQRSYSYDNDSKSTSSRRSGASRTPEEDHSSYSTDQKKSNGRTSPEGRVNYSSDERPSSNKEGCP